MAIYHLTTRTGQAHTGQAGRHAEYIEREGIYQDRSDLIAMETGNMPTWAKDDSGDFWRASDKLERANGRAYREFEMALPRELSHEQQASLVRQFAREQFEEHHAYEWAIHDKGDGNPHVHIMFSERVQDEIDRPMEQYFKRANGKNPERGGCRKDDRWNVGRGQKSEVLLEARGRWADLQNIYLEQVGELTRVDHRSLEAQGIDRRPQIHVGPCATAMERRGGVTERGELNRAIKLVNQEPQARDRLGVSQAGLVAAERELAEITGTIREMEAQEKAVATRSSEIERVWFAFFDSTTWRTRAGSQRILSREQNSPEVQARISLEMPPKCVLSEDGRTWSGVFRDAIEAANYGRAQALEERKAESERKNKEYIEKKNQEKFIRDQENELLKKFRNEICSYDAAVSKEKIVFEKINGMDLKINTLVKEIKDHSGNIKHAKWHEMLNPFKLERINKNAKRIDKERTACLEARKNLETELDEIRKVKDIFWRREAPERKLAEAEKERQKFEQEKAAQQAKKIQEQTKSLKKGRSGPDRGGMEM